MQRSELVMEASARAIAIMESTQTPLIPFTLLLKPSFATERFQVTVTSFASEIPGQSLQHAQASLKSNAGILMYALAWPSSVTINGRTWEAVLVECGTPKCEEGAIYAQCYEQQRVGLFKTKFRILPFGEPFVIRSCTSKLWNPQNSNNPPVHERQPWVGFPEPRQPEHPMLH
jgi:hypothetical protein